MRRLYQPTYTSLYPGRVIQFRDIIKKYWILPAIALFFLILILRLSLTHTERPSGNCYAKAAVATDSENCSKIGRDILQGNGSAVDAAIAALLCLSVINPHSMGIGGGVVFTIYNPSTGKVETINARETAPSAFKNMSDKHLLNTTKEKPGLSIAVPGELRGYEMAHQKYGRLQWRELFEPSINLAKKGFRIGKALAKAISDEKSKILNDTALCEVFCDSSKLSILKENDTIVLFKLADTYEKIAEGGADVFYNGPLTEIIVDDIKQQGGIITREDLMNYKAEQNEYALNFTAGNYTFYVPDAPFGGPVLALIFNILKGYNLSRSSVSTTEIKTLTYHRMIEAFRLANAEKSKLGDPHYGNVTEIVKNMTSDHFADYIRSMIKDNITKKDRDDVNTCNDHGTSHLSVIAEDGSAVAVTSSINNEFGSGVRSCSTGIIFNDQMCDFSDPNSVLNEINKNNLIKPGKRPLSSMSPTIILDKESKQVKMVVGGAGGKNITTATAQVILNYLFFDYGLRKAVEEPRFQVPIKVTNVEKGLDQKVSNGLNETGHNIQNDPEVTSVQVVVQQGNKICAESDHRNYGHPAGY